MTTPAPSPACPREPSPQAAGAVAPGVRAVPWGQMLAVIAAVLLASLWRVSQFLYGCTGLTLPVLLTGLLGGLCLLACVPMVGLVILLKLRHDWRTLSLWSRIGRGLLFLVLPVAFGVIYVIPREACFVAGVKHRVKKAGGVDQLRAWALATIEAERAKPGGEEEREIEALPDHVRALRRGSATACVDTRHGVVAVFIGERDMQLWLVVGDTSYAPTEGQTPFMNKLWDGVYLCRGSDWRDPRLQGLRR